MKYWQITTSRLSRAAKKLEQDGEWHPFESMPRAWYRVWKKRLVQRVNFVDGLEEQALLPLIRPVEPIESMGRTEGFREEMEIRAQDDRFSVVVPLGYAPENMVQLAAKFEENNLYTEASGNLLSVIIPLQSLNRAELTRAREELALARQLFGEMRAS